MSFPVPASVSTAAAESGVLPALTPPTGLAVGDLLVVAGTGLAAGTSSGVVGAPSTGGWTSIGTPTGQDGVFWKIADATDVAASSLAPSIPGTTGGSSSDAKTAAAYRITGIDTSNPIQVATALEGWSGSSPSASGITITGRQCLLLMLMLRAGSSTSNLTWSGYAVATSNPTWTEQVDIDNNGTTSTRRAGQAGATAPYAGTLGVSTGNFSATPSVSTGSGVMVLLAIQPPVVSVSAAAASVSTKGITFIRKMVLTAISILASVPGGTASSIAQQKWAPTAKHNAAWTPEDKS
jgi:hypothetical protein